MDVEVLGQSGAGRAVNKLRKHQQPEIASRARAVQVKAAEDSLRRQLAALLGDATLTLARVPTYDSEVYSVQRQFEDGARQAFFAKRYPSKETATALAATVQSSERIGGEAALSLARSPGSSTSRGM